MSSRPPADGGVVRSDESDWVPRLMDSHCHLQDEPDPLATAARALGAGVAYLVCVGTDLATSKEAIRLASQLPGQMWATAGIHPHEAVKVDELAEIPALAAEEAVVAIGECGLDYYYDHSPRPAQRDAFAVQVELARSLRTTLVVHTREAWDDTLAVIREVGVPPRVIFHCFSGQEREAASCLELGAWLSFSGMLTFRSASELRAAARLCPEERLLVETDSPYLTPVPHRGRRNEPAFVQLVAAALASERGTSIDRLAPRLLSNSFEAFGLAECQGGTFAGPLGRRDGA